MKIIVEGRWNAAFSFNRKGRYPKLAVINRTDGVVDQQLFRFSDIIGQQAVRGRDPINPHIWDYNGRLEWYRPISQEQRSQIANTILDYVEMYQEETEENDFTMKL